jgi:hypothetical protein
VSFISIIPEIAIQSELLLQFRGAINAGGLIFTDSSATAHQPAVTMVHKGEERVHHGKRIGPNPAT